METLDRKPTLQQWINDNPRASINEYYRIFGAQEQETHVQETYKATIVETPMIFQAPSVSGFFITPLKAVLAVIIALIVIMALTNPDETKHKETLKHEIVNAMGMEKTVGNVTKEFGYEGLGAFAGRAVAMQFADLAVNSMVSVDSYVFFSFTKATFDEETNIIGIGMLGNVYISNEVQKKIKEHLKR